MRRRASRPELRIELTDLGTVDPFALEVVERPPGSGDFFVQDPARGERAALAPAGLSLAGAGQALLSLSMRWMARVDRGPEGGAPPENLAEVRMAVRRREARLLASLLRRHLQRLPEPPAWMAELLGALEQVDEFLRWEEG